MATIYTYENNLVFLQQEKINSSKRLENKTYVVRNHPEMGLYLEETDGFTLPEVMYGDVHKRCERIINTFKSRSTTTSVLLSGEKGSGKSLLMKLLSVKLDMPTIIVNAPYCGDNFNSFINKIDQEAIFIFDEFEKVYSDDEDQEKLLTLLDGLFSDKRLFVFTCNELLINQNMLNRPGRIFYHIEYKGLEYSFIEDYCKRNLNNMSYFDDVIKISVAFRDKFNFDMLKALVEEVNRYGESPIEAVKWLNICPINNTTFMRVTLFDPNGDEVDQKRYKVRTVHFDPTGFDLDIWVKTFFKNEDDEEEGYTEDRVSFYHVNDPMTINKDRSIHFINGEGWKLVLKDVDAQKYW